MLIGIMEDKEKQIEKIMIAGDSLGTMLAMNELDNLLD